MILKSKSIFSKNGNESHYVPEEVQYGLTAPSLTSNERAFEQGNQSQYYSGQRHFTPCRLCTCSFTVQMSSSTSNKQTEYRTVVDY